MKLYTNGAVLALQVCLARHALAEPIPAPSGKYNVGVRRHVIDFTNEGDPTSPSNVSTEYLATLYYPTLDEPGPAVPYLEPELAQQYADVWEFNISHLTATFRHNASFLHKPTGPTLLFGPGGWGPPTDGYGIVLSDLASQGYVIAAIDHVYEQPFLRFPNGTGVYGLRLDFPADVPFVEALHRVRVREQLHFIEHLPKLARKWGAPLKTHRVGTFGHSLGGSVALTLALESDKVAAAINLDGTNWNKLNSSAEEGDLGSTPSLILGFDQHTDSTDRTWNNFAKWQTGWWRLLTVDGTEHLDWSDATFWKKWGATRPMGPIDGRRMAKITSAYVKAFFDDKLLGKETSLLDGDSEEWPEVNYINGGPK